MEQALQAASWRDYLELTKPKVVALMLLTAVIGMCMAVPGMVPWQALVFGNLGIALCAGSLLGFPPLLGFIGKFYLFVAGVDAGQIALVVIAAVNSAISAWYYLQIAGLPILAGPTAASETIVRTPAAWPRVAALLAAVAVVVLALFAEPLLKATEGSGAGRDVVAVEPSGPPGS